MLNNCSNILNYINNEFKNDSLKVSYTVLKNHLDSVVNGAIKSRLKYSTMSGRWNIETIEKTRNEFIKISKSWNNKSNRQLHAHNLAAIFQHQNWHFCGENTALIEHQIEQSSSDEKLIESCFFKIYLFIDLISQHLGSSQDDGFNELFGKINRKNISLTWHNMDRCSNGEIAGFLQVLKSQFNYKNIEQRLHSLEQDGNNLAKYFLDLYNHLNEINPTETIKNMIPLCLDMIDFSIFMLNNHHENSINSLTKLPKLVQIPKENLVQIEETIAAIISGNMSISILPNVVQIMNSFPCGHAFQRFHQVTSDLAHSLNKKVKFSIKGGEIQLPNKSIQLLDDALIHLLRNSLDHGIELPEARKNIHKPEFGCIELTVKKDDRNYYVNLKDDGKGIDPVIIRKKALSSLDIKPEVLDHMSDGEIQKLIFKAGFSTAEELSHLSGRGVGMDAVNYANEKLKGIINLNSEVGKGTEIEFVFPCVNKE